MALSRSALAVLLLAAGCGGLQVRSPVATTGAPSSFVRTTSDARSTRILVVRSGLTKNAAFRAVSDYLAGRFTVDVSDQRAGFLMTPWRNSSVRDGAPDIRYRTRVVVRFLGDDWQQMSVRVEANWQRGDEWDVGVDAALLDDVAAALRERVSAG